MAKTNREMELKHSDGCGTVVIQAADVNSGNQCSEQWNKTELMN